MSDPAASSFGAKMEILRQRFYAKAVGDFDALERIAAAIQGGTAVAEDLARAYQLLHKLAGSAGTFGFAALGQEARQLELLLKPVIEPGADTRADLADLDRGFGERLTLVRALLETEETPSPQSPSNHADTVFPETQRGMMLVIDPDESRARRLIDGLTLYGYALRWAPDAGAWQRQFDQTPALLIVSDQLFLAQGDQFAGFLNRLPVICVGASDSLSLRYRLASEGADAFFCEPFNLPLLADHLERLLSEQVDTDSGRVLIVDDDPELLAHYQLVLTNGGVEVRTVAGDPARLMAELAEFRPDILLMDVHMGNISGPALARMVRFDADWLSLPIIYLSAEQDRELQLEALAKGGDDFLTKPVSDSFLLRTVRLRCYRARQLDKLVSRDSLTGLLKHSLVKSEVAKEHARCLRSGHQSVLAMLDLDHFKGVNDSHGHLAGDLVIKGLANLLVHRLRKTDVVGRYGGEEFIVVLPECTPDSAIELFRSICEDFSRLVFEGKAGHFSVTLSVGLSVLSDYGSSEQAIEAADQALYQQKRAGRNGVSAAIR